MWLLNSQHDIMYRYALGDKDLYRLAFVLADKEAAFQQLSLPPRIALASLEQSEAARKVTREHGRIAASHWSCLRRQGGADPRATPLYDMASGCVCTPHASEPEALALDVPYEPRFRAEFRMVSLKAWSYSSSGTTGNGHSVICPKVYFFC